jgi:hypothetical protein
VEDLVTQEARSPVWSKKVLEWRGEPSIEPFESSRAEFFGPNEDPLA